MVLNTYQKSSQGELFPEMVGPDYAGFLNEIQNKFPIIRNKLEYDTEAKKNVIKKYFLGLYKKNGVADFSSQKIGVLFLSLTKSAELQIEKAKKEAKKKKKLLEQII